MAWAAAVSCSSTAVLGRAELSRNRQTKLGNPREDLHLAKDPGVSPPCNRPRKLTTFTGPVQQRGMKDTEMSTGPGPAQIHREFTRSHGCLLNQNGGQMDRHEKDPRATMQGQVLGLGLALAVVSPDARVGGGWRQRLLARPDRISLGPGRLPRRWKTGLQRGLDFLCMSSASAPSVCVCQDLVPAAPTLSQLHLGPPGPQDTAATHGANPGTPDPAQTAGADGQRQGLTL